MANSQPVQLTKTRVDALLSLALKGEEDLFYYWFDTYGINVLGLDDVTIRRQIEQAQEAHPDLKDYEVWDAVQKIRQARAARQILARRYA
jgi:hypothetical protein